jgi:diguanylate cyclase (GGDEF)-like protein
MIVAPRPEHDDNGGLTGSPLSQTKPKLIDVSAADPAGAVGAAPEEATPPRKPMSMRARVYVAVLGAVAGAAGIAGIAELRPDTPGWLAFVVLTVVAALAQLFIVEKGSNQSYRTAIAFILAAAILLKPGFLVLLVVLHYVPAWLKYRKRWVIQIFNLSNTTLAALAAWAAFHALSDSNVLMVGNARFALAGLAACVAFVAVNHALLSGIISLTSGTKPWATGLFGFESLSTDLGLAALGVGVAAFWSVNGWLILFVITPLVLIHRAMYVPQLQEKARLDPKTGLLNAREFESTLVTELERSQRTGAPVSLLMADLDFLRDVNNTYGHLAGDVVIKGIADELRAQMRRYDIAARFGGEEFSVLLPETPPAQALLIAERIRAAVADRLFEVDTSPEPIRATLSIGVATCPDDATGAKELVHEADLAVYAAKAGGRNRVVARVDVADAPVA